jgi:hypothetical protein
MALLPAEALNFRHRDAGDTDIVERFLHFIELERLNDGFDLLHANPQPVVLTITTYRPGRPASSGPM